MSPMPNQQPPPLPSTVATSLDIHKAPRDSDSLTCTILFDWIDELGMLRRSREYGYFTKAEMDLQSFPDRLKLYARHISPPNTFWRKCVKIERTASKEMLHTVKAVTATNDDVGQKEDVSYLRIPKATFREFWNDYIADLSPTKLDIADIAIQLNVLKNLKTAMSAISIQRAPSPFIVIANSGDFTFTFDYYECVVKEIKPIRPFSKCTWYPKLETYASIMKKD